MRVHRLEMTAFGPFAGTEIVDVDALAEAGLFLIHGPTGAGKTTLLDAICFALYAGLPGHRSERADKVGGGLRSHHAAEDAVPRVVLEFTASGRRLRVTRQPAFRRPGRSTPVQAKVDLEEWIGGRWRPAGSRHDEVGDVINDVMGMGRAQFERVVLLPQGEFAAFLRASAEERRKVLERLFDVEIYDGVESVLAERRRDLAGLVDQQAALAARVRDELLDVLARADDLSSDTAEPTESAVPELAASVGWSRWDDLSAAEAAELATATRAALGAAVTAAMVAQDQAEAVEQAAVQEASAAERLAALQAKARAATEDRDRLAAAAQNLAVQRERVAAARRAGGLRGHLAALQRAERSLASREDEAAGVRAQRQALVGDWVGSDVDLVVALEAFDATVTEVEHVAADAARLQAQGVAAREESDQRAVAATMARALLDAAVATVAEADARVRATAEARALLPAAVARVDQLTDLCTLRERLEEAQQSIHEVTGDLDRTREAELDARQSLLDLQQARIDGMAGELAAALHDGQSCPVCGAVEHPRPATAGAPISVEAIAAAQQHYDTARRAREEVAEHLAGLRAAAAAALTSLGEESRDLAELRAARHEAAQPIDALRLLAADHQAAQAVAEAASAKVEQARAHETAATQASAVAQAAAAVLADDLSAAAVRLAEALDRHTACPCGGRGTAAGSIGGDPAGQDVGRVVEEAASAVAHHQSALTAAREAAAMAGSVAAAEVEVAQASQACTEAADQAGFADLADAAAAMLEPADIEALARRLKAHDDAVVAVETILGDPEVVAADALPPADVDAARAMRDVARRATRAAVTKLTQAQAAHERAAHLLQELADLRPRLAELRAAFATVREVAQTTAGQNARKMPLASYVLAARLERVVALANERLGVMGEGRFELRHTDERVGAARSGLGLEVIDRWTGRTRSTSTLSGGESFMASLALALGLADAVREESGGREVQTLFVDEGFGTLDDESLEQVMTVLDSLRDGGRVVGVVSHVADLRTRIPWQLEVHKGRHGSRVSTRGEFGAISA